MTINPTSNGIRLVRSKVPRQARTSITKEATNTDGKDDDAPRRSNSNWPARNADHHRTPVKIKSVEPQKSGPPMPPVELTSSDHICPAGTRMRVDEIRCRRRSVPTKTRHGIAARSSGTRTYDQGGAKSKLRSAAERSPIGRSGIETAGRSRTPRRNAATQDGVKQQHGGIVIHQIRFADDSRRRHWVESSTRTGRTQYGMIALCKGKRDGG